MAGTFAFETNGTVWSGGGARARESLSTVSVAVSAAQTNVCLSPQVCLCSGKRIGEERRPGSVQLHTLSSQ